MSGRAGRTLSDQSYVARLTRASGSNFYYSFLFLPKPQREAMHAVYAFCREVDDSVDAAPDGGEAARQVGFWRRELDACYHGTPTHPITRSLSTHLHVYPIRRRNLEEIIEGVEMDIVPRRYATFEQLREYCYRVASAVGLVCVEIFGYTNPAAREYAVALGMAFQMTNILRDVRCDAERGRIYLPADEMARFACRDEELRAAAPSPGFAALMQFECDRAGDLFRQASGIFPVEDRSRLFAAEIMGEIYAALLGKIVKRGYDVLHGSVRLSRPRKLLIATRCYLRSRAA